ncbi:MAG: B12-binding domain-containing radical SAM protein [Candidatus Omnitrophica bacterium]|nr:B12-binding domain-containing radical SAM protein [Candidatus Omnitrophota bacterium]
MKVAIAYPPLESKKGTPLLSQNRQFQYFKEPTYIYPVVPATAATILKNAGHEVLWIDGIAERISYKRFLEILCKEKPDLIALETKTPVIKQHWRIIDELKKLYNPLTVLFGDHVTALPEESFKNSSVDFVLTGGDYDFLLLNLCNNLKLLNTKYSLLTTNLEAGIYYREDGQIKSTGRFQIHHDLNALPFIDRELTKWKLYAYKNGNYKCTPGTYIMAGRDCWWGKCKFCAWPILYPAFRVRKVDAVLGEIGYLLENYPIREIMDDTGTFPVGEWLREFCRGMVKYGYHKRIFLDCNMRFGALSREDFYLMKKANFRLLLFGLESANQKTLRRINKNLTVEKIIEDCKLARGAGLYPHITIMFGYPWETYEDALKTLKLGKWLLRKGYAYTVQATLVIPYPGTPLFEECKENNWLKTLDWERFDMKEPVMKTSIPDKILMKLVQGIYRVSFHPEFIYNRIRSIRDFHDLIYFRRTVVKVLGHIKDFS